MEASGLVSALPRPRRRHIKGQILRKSTMIAFLSPPLSMAFLGLSLPTLACEGQRDEGGDGGVADTCFANDFLDKLLLLDS